MAYEHGATYWICPVDNTGVALSVRGDSQVSQNRDVFLYTKEDIDDQLWRVDVGDGFARIKSTLDDRYALNIYRSTGNCDIYTWARKPHSFWHSLPKTSRTSLSGQTLPQAFTALLAMPSPSRA